MGKSNSLYISIGSRIAEARQALGILQEDAAKAIGVTRVTWNHIEKGNQKLAVDRLLEIAKFLKVKPVKLVPGLDEEATDVLTDFNFTPEEQSKVLEKLEKHRKGK